MQVVLDSTQPWLTGMQVSKAPTAAAPIFQLTLNFSEPVQWLLVSAAAGTAVQTNGSTSIGITASSEVLLTNTMLLNISMVPGAAALVGGQASGAASAFHMWLRSWSGATATVIIRGPAFQDLAGNLGQRDAQLQVGVLEAWPHMLPPGTLTG